MSHETNCRTHTFSLSTPIQVVVAAVAACFIAGPVLSNPVNPTVVTGTATFNQTGNVLTVTNSNGAIINWQQFNIGAGETTHFAQASASSSVLNRVLANDPSLIYGTLSSNGRVWLVNPAGILVGAGGRVDVAGFVASTLNISNADFLAGRNLFVNDGTAQNVINQGEIRTPSGGSVYLVGSNVTNEGLIHTPAGETILAAGQTVSLIDSATPGVKVDITGAAGNATNLGTITAEAGRIGIAGVIVRNSGLLNASSVVNEGGRIFLKATGDTLVEGGRLDATSVGGKGGQVDVLGDRVAVMNDAEIDVSGTAGGGYIRVGGDYQGKNSEIQNASITYLGKDAVLRADATEVGAGGTVIVWADDTARAYGSIFARGGATGGNGGFVETSGKKHLSVNRILVNTGGGNWLLDPSDFTIAAAGGDISGADLSTNLAGGSITILSSGGAVSGGGDIIVNDAVSWNANALTLTAARDVRINAVVTASGTSSLLMNTSTGNGTDVGVAGGTVVTGTAGRVDFPGRSGTGFLTINGHAYQVIEGLGAQGSVTGTDLQGLANIGYFALGSDIDASLTSGWNGGAGFAPIGNSVTPFLGRMDGLGHTVSGLLINRPTTDDVGLFSYVGIGAAVVNLGLIGGSVTGAGRVGALAGDNRGTLNHVYASSAVSGTGSDGVGGLVGWNQGGISESYASGSVVGRNNIHTGDFGTGGLVGENRGPIMRSFATGDVTSAGSSVGGLVGADHDQITDSYATGAVRGDHKVGGLVGWLGGSGGITRVYAAGTARGHSNLGGLVGNRVAGTNITDGYWNLTANPVLTTTGAGSDSGGTGLTTAELNAASFVSFSFPAVWRLDGPAVSPYLAWTDMPTASAWTLIASAMVVNPPELTGGNDATGNMSVVNDINTALERASTGKTPIDDAVPRLDIAGNESDGTDGRFGSDDEGIGDKKKSDQTQDRKTNEKPAKKKLPQCS